MISLFNNFGGDFDRACRNENVLRTTFEWKGSGDNEIKLTFRKWFYSENLGPYLIPKMLKRYEALPTLPDPEIPLQQLRNITGQELLDPSRVRYDVYLTQTDNVGPLLDLYDRHISMIRERKPQDDFITKCNEEIDAINTLRNFEYDGLLKNKERVEKAIIQYSIEEERTHRQYSH